MEIPPIRLTKMGDVRIAYQVLGDGPVDVVLQPGWPSQLEVMWEHPAVARFCRRLASFSRLIIFDWRGTGLSERGAFDRRDGVRDIATVLDTVGSERCWFIGCHVAARFGVLFVTSSTDRASGLVTIGGHPANYRDEDYPWGTTHEEMESIAAELRSYTRLEDEGIARFLGLVAPSATDDPATLRWWNRLQLAAMSPTEALAALWSDADLDVRPLLGAVRVPTLVLCRVGDRFADVNASRYLADHIPGARLVELQGEDHLPYFGDQEAILDAIEEFLKAGARRTSRREGSPRCSSPTSSGRRRAQQSSAIVAGATFLTSMMRPPHVRSSATAADSWTGREMASWPRSTAPPERSAVPSRCARSSRAREFKRERVFTRGRLNFGERRSAALPCISPPAFRPSPGQERSWCPERSPTSSQARASGSPTVANISSRAFRGPGACSPWRTERSIQ